MTLMVVRLSLFSVITCTHQQEIEIRISFAEWWSLLVCFKCKNTYKTLICDTVVADHAALIVCQRSTRTYQLFLSWLLKLFILTLCIEFFFLSG